MSKPTFLYILAAVAVFATASCSRNPFEVESVEVTEGRSFRICLDKALPPEQQYFYSIQFITKDSLRYTTDGALNTPSESAENCFAENKFRYDMSAYADESIRFIESLSNQNLDTCRVQIYSDNQLEQRSLVFEKVFTAEDLN